MKGNITIILHGGTRQPIPDTMLHSHPDPTSYYRVAITVCLILLLAACNQNAQETTTRTPPPVGVKTVHPVQQELVDWDEYTGRVEAIQSVDVRARVNGYLEQVNFRAGDRVRKGDLLFVIDPRNFAAELKRAEAELTRIRSQMELARHALERADRLRKTRAISEEEYDQRSDRLTGSTAMVQAAEAAVQLARLNLEFTRIRAPIDGRIGRELVTPGNLISGDQTLLATLVSIDPVYVYLDTDEHAVLKYRRLAAAASARGETNTGRVPAQLALVDEQGYPHSGYLNYVDPRVDATTGTLKVRGVFANPGELLSPGLFARVRIHSGQPAQGLLVPDRAISTDQDRKFVWLAKPDGSTEIRKITPGGLFGSFRLIREGLSPEDTVIVEGTGKLRPGSRVQPEAITLPFDG